MVFLYFVLDAATFWRWQNFSFENWLFVAVLNSNYFMAVKFTIRWRLFECLRTKQNSDISGTFSIPQTAVPSRNSLDHKIAAFLFFHYQLPASFRDIWVKFIYNYCSHFMISTEKMFVIFFLIWFLSTFVDN